MEKHSAPITDAEARELARLIQRAQPTLSEAFWFNALLQRLAAPLKEDEK